MKIFSFVLVILLSFSAVAAPSFWNTDLEGVASIPYANDFDESVNFQPGLNLYTEAAQLTDLYGTKGSQLCAPNSFTHLSYYLRASHPSHFNLAPAPDMDNDGTSDTFKDQIRYFFQLCSTDRENGTYYQKGLECVRTYITNSGYTPWAYMIGSHSRDGDGTLTAVTPDILRYYLAGGVGVVMMIGWYKKNAQGAYERTSGHFFNIYGYDYNTAWGTEKITLKAVNSWINYTGRDRTQMYDDITMTKIVTGIDKIDYKINGPGFDFAEYTALIDDILIVLPVVK